MMMMANPKRKIASVIVEKLGAPEAKPVDGSKPEEDNSVGLKAAAEKMLQAIEAKDAGMLASALTDFNDIAETAEEPAADDGE